MKTYICYYSCPFCNNPCTVPFDPNEEFNEMVDAENKAEARKFFNNAKMCRNMKITRIVEDKQDSGVTNIEVNGVKYNTLEDALSAINFKVSGVMHVW